MSHQQYSSLHPGQVDEIVKLLNYQLDDRNFVELGSNGAGNSLSLGQLTSTKNFPLAQPTLILAGDSRNANGVTSIAYQAQGYFIALNNILGGRFDIRASTAVVGVDTAHLLNVQMPAILAMPLQYSQYVALDIGHNDIAGVRSAELAYANVVTFIANMYATGRKVILATSGSSTVIAGNTTYLAGLKRLNQYYRQQGSVLPGVVRVIDPYSTVTDTTNGSFTSALYLADQIHYNPTGAMKIALAAKPLIDPLIPVFSVLSTDVNNNTQLVQNPRMNGNNAAGSNGWTLTGGAAPNTGTGPDNWGGIKVDASLNTSTSSGASGVYSKVTRTDKTGTLAQCSHTGGLAFEGTGFQHVSLQIVNWTSNLAVTTLFRIRPTVPTGVGYRVVTAGNLASGADPTANWSTVLGVQFASGTATLEVVNSIDVGDTVQLVVEAFMSSFSGAAAIITNMIFLTSAFGVIDQCNGNYCNSGTGLIADSPAGQIIKANPKPIPANTAIISIKIFCVSAAGVTGVYQIGECDLVKY